MYKATIVYNDDIKDIICFNVDKRIIYEDENYFYLGDKDSIKVLKGVVKYIMVEENKK